MKPEFVLPRPPAKAVTSCTPGSLPHNLRQLQHLLLHLRKRNILLPLHLPADASRILLREESLRNQDVQIHIQHKGQHGDRQHQLLMLQHPAQSALILRRHPLQRTLAKTIKPSMPPLVVRLQKLRAQHRRRRQRNHQRHHNRHRQRHRKLAKQPADNPTHQQNRNEHRNQRRAHRQHRKPDLLRSQHRRIVRRHSRFEMPADVLNHNNRVVHHETRRDRQRHQRQIIERIPQQIHHRKGSQQAQRNRDGRNQRRSHLAQEEEHHQDHQYDRDHQRPRHIPHRGANRRRPVQRHMHLDRRRYRRLQHRQHLLHVIDRLDHIRRRRLEHDHQNRRLAVEHTRRMHILDAVNDLATS